MEKIKQQKLSWASIISDIKNLREKDNYLSGLTNNIQAFFNPEHDTYEKQILLTSCYILGVNQMYSSIVKKDTQDLLYWLEYVAFEIEKFKDDEAVVVIDHDRLTGEMNEFDFKNLDNITEFFMLNFPLSP